MTAQNFKLLQMHPSILVVVETALRFLSFIFFNSHTDIIMGLLWLTVQEYMETINYELQEISLILLLKMISTGLALLAL